MPNILDSVIANEALQQTGAPPYRPRLFICFLEPLQPGLQLPTKRLVIKVFTHFTHFIFFFLQQNSLVYVDPHAADSKFDIRGGQTSTNFGYNI